MLSAGLMMAHRLRRRSSIKPTASIVSVGHAASEGLHNIQLVLVETPARCPQGEDWAFFSLSSAPWAR